MTGPATDGQSMSTLLGDLAASVDGGPVTVGAVVDRLSDRAFAALLLMFSFPAAAPFVSPIFGLPLVILSGQLAIGRRGPWLPGPVQRREVSGDRLAAVLRRAVPRLVRVERIIQPRLTFLTTGVAERVIGGILFLLAVMLFAPAPGTNAPLAAGIAVIALGLVEDDGVVVALGLLIGLAGAALFTAYVAAVGLALLNADRLPDMLGWLSGLTGEVAAPAVPPGPEAVTP